MASEPTPQTVGSHSVAWAARAYVAAAATGLAFGAADQFLGSRSALGSWVIAVSQMSAAWIALPFVVGTTQERRGRAMALAVVATVAALLGYFVLTCSAFENVPTERLSSCFITVARTGYNPLWIVGGILSAPVLGLLGQAWRTRRAWLGPVVVAAALCLEPLARQLVGMLTPPSRVWFAEIVVGVALASVLLAAGSRDGRGPPDDDDGRSRVLRPPPEAA